MFKYFQMEFEFRKSIRGRNQIKFCGKGYKRKTEGRKMHKGKNNWNNTSQTKVKKLNTGEPSIVCRMKMKHQLTLIIFRKEKKVFLAENGNNYWGRLGKVSRIIIIIYY